MKVKDIFALGLKTGMAADPRGEKGVKKYLAKVKKEYGDLKPSEKEFFDEVEQ